VGQVFKFVWRLFWKINVICMSLSPFDSFQSRFVNYLLNCPRTCCILSCLVCMGVYCLVYIVAVVSCVLLLCCCTVGVCCYRMCNYCTMCVFLLLL
jgi:hypothetical protein